MTTPLENTWAKRELPILRAALRRLDAGEVCPGVAEIQEDTGLDQAQMSAGIFALETASPPYIELEAYNVRLVSERARRELGTWPSAETLVDRLAAALAEAADAEAEPQRKGKFQAAAEAVGGFARDVAVGVVSGQLGG